ncbi:MAG TPA: GNAT family N-acetyltransferase [Janthinobacterium sp.]|jgi:phosphinothricin acetyltransferase|nr:GNAT family N-acetyltransferase [Janthinobacterium sp.]
MIRSASPADAAAICAIYNHYVLNTAVNFEHQPAAEALMAAHIASHALPWLVLEEDGQVLAYAYAGACPAYHGAADTTIYVAPGNTGRGLGRQIYAELIAILRRRGLHSLIAGIALPNPASAALHESLGFKKVGHFEEVGWKQGRWIDVGYWQLKLS